MERSKAVKCRRRRSLPFCLACFLLPLVSLLRGSPLSRFLASAPCHTRAYLFISLVPDAIKFTLENHALYMNDLSKFDPSSYHTLALLSLASPLENNLLPKRVFVFFGRCTSLATERESNNPKCRLFIPFATRANHATSAAHTLCQYACFSASVLSTCTLHSSLPLPIIPLYLFALTNYSRTYEDTYSGKKRVKK